MTDIRFLPIFDQSVPGVWHDLARIRVMTFLSDCCLDAEDIANKIRTRSEIFARLWRDRRCKYAFGAYDGNDIVGFALGYSASRNAWIDSLFVLPKYHRQGIGSHLLGMMEHSMKLVATSVELWSLEEAMEFYEIHGYAQYSCLNHYIKFLRGRIRNDTVPIFKVNASLARQCYKINPGFLGENVNRAHQAMFAHFDGHACLDGYIGAGTSVPCLRDDAPDSVRKVLQNRFDAFIRENQKQK